MVKTLHSQCRGYRFNPWSGNWDPTCCTAWPKKQNKEKAGSERLCNLFRNNCDGMVNVEVSD